MPGMDRTTNKLLAGWWKKSDGWAAEDCLHEVTLMTVREHADKTT